MNDKTPMGPMQARAEAVFRRTYSRPLEGEGCFETWDQTINRVISHQRWLWERATKRPLNGAENDELLELYLLLVDRNKAVLAGRTMWLGGTETAKKREASQFNCSNTLVETVHDAVDFYWLLLQGCGLGGGARIGTLSGFTNPVPQIDVVRSRRTKRGGKEGNLEKWDSKSSTWTLVIGDSAEAWAKSIGKILAMKQPAKKIVLDFTEVRPAGERLKGYGWISSGDHQISKAFPAICSILSRRSGRLLTKIDCLDIVNLLGQTLTSRRSAEIFQMDHGDPEWIEFAGAKRNMWDKGLGHREMSNNSLMFWQKPNASDLYELFDIIKENGGSEPGLINASAARERAPWFTGFNPCAEIMLPNKGFCNLCDINLAGFSDDYHGLMRATYLVARANYRQTLVDLNDGMLQAAWDQNNQFLRLCGVSLTGHVLRPDLGSYEFRQIRIAAHRGAHGMAAELGTQPPKNVTTIKPSGTASKLMGTTEGIHCPGSRFLINNMNFSSHDPMVDALARAGYRVRPSPTDSQAVLVSFPVGWPELPQFCNEDGKWINREPAVCQLGRYKDIMSSYVDQNCSITVSYDDDEIPTIMTWLLNNWDSYVAVSFLPRGDFDKTAEDLGYLYLPQEPMRQVDYESYVSKIGVPEFSAQTTETEPDEECAGGACPVR
jgi:ribonucleoside-triphosphate reductase